MRTKITIIFETYGTGTAEQHNDWPNELLEKIADALRLTDDTNEGFPPATFDIVSIEELPDEK